MKNGIMLSVVMWAGLRWLLYGVTLGAEFKWLEWGVVDYVLYMLPQRCVAFGFWEKSTRFWGSQETHCSSCYSD